VAYQAAVPTQCPVLRCAAPTPAPCAASPAPATFAATGSPRNVVVAGQHPGAVQQELGSNVEEQAGGTHGERTGQEALREPQALLKGCQPSVAAVGMGSGGPLALPHEMTPLSSGTACPPSRDDTLVQWRRLLGLGCLPQGWCTPPAPVCCAAVLICADAR
jgi:hypothetical protein